MMGRLIAIFSLIVLLAACGTSQHMPSDNKLPRGHQGGIQKVGKPYKVGGEWYYPESDPYYDRVGHASWYGKQFHGRKTANGETYNMNALTAAHKTLPMPTYVKVTNLSNGRSIVLRVNDRGPFVAGRLIDVSRRAAQLLGFQQKGVTQVRVQAVDENGRVRRGKKRPPRVLTTQASSAKTSPDKSHGHFVQVGAFANLSNARSRQQALKQAGQKARISKEKIGDRSLFRVRVGPYKSRGTAQSMLDRILALGFYDARIFALK